MSQSQQAMPHWRRPMADRPGFGRLGIIGIPFASTAALQPEPANPMTITPYQCISAAEAAALLRAEARITVFDVRDATAYRQGHLADAAHLAEERLPGWFRRLPKEQPVLIYCYKGNASKVFAQMFSDFRFQRVFSVDGGYAALLGALA